VIACCKGRYVYNFFHLCSFLRSLWEAGTVTIIGPITATVEDAILVLVIGFNCQFPYKQIVNSGHENLWYHLTVYSQTMDFFLIYLFDLITYAPKIIMVLHCLHSASISFNFMWAKQWWRRYN